MTAKVILSGFISVPVGDVQTVLDHLSVHIELTLVEPGCLVFKVTQRMNAPNIFDVYEEFQDADAFSAHQARVQASLWGEVSKNVLRSYSVSGI